jgi:hypothetical protein
MPSTRIKSRVAIVVCFAIAAFGAAVAQARPIGDPPANSKRTQPIRAKVTKRVARSTRFDPGYPFQSGSHVYSAAEAKTE